MATTTPNFGWAVPTSSDLVKSGALAIETLGDAIDASMVDLKGGTTGQVLAKATNTDMDFTWTTPSTSAGFADNGVLNSGFNVWQRGTSVSGAGGGAYTADRWMLYAGGQATASRQATGDTTNLPMIQYCARVQRNSGSSDTTGIPFGQSFETVNSIPFAGKTVTLSFYARKGANFSATSDQIGVTLATGTGTDQNYLSAGYTGAATPISQAVTLTSTWQRFTYSATLAATTTELAIRFFFGPTGTAGAADYFEVTGIQIEVGSSATAYHPNQPTYQAELAACQRYYYRFTGNSTYNPIGTGYATATTTASGFIPLPTVLRTFPSSVDYTNLSVVDGLNVYASTGLTIGSSALSMVRLDLTGLSSLTQFRPLSIVLNNTSNQFIGFSAEL